MLPLSMIYRWPLTKMHSHCKCVVVGCLGVALPLRRLEQARFIGWETVRDLWQWHCFKDCTVIFVVGFFFLMPPAKCMAFGGIMCELRKLWEDSFKYFINNKFSTQLFMYLKRFSLNNLKVTVFAEKTCFQPNETCRNPILQWKT